MPAGDEQAHRNRREGSVLELVDDDMAGEMVDGVDRDPQAEGERLGRCSANEECARESWAGGHGDGIKVRERDPRLGTRPLEGRDHRLEVGSARDFGDDPAEARVLLDARRHGIGEKRGTPDDADACLVAGGLDAQYQGFAHVPLPVIGRSRMITASTPRS